MSESEGAIGIPSDSPRIRFRRKIAIDQPLTPPIPQIASPTTPHYRGLLSSIVLALIAQYVLIVLPEKSLPQILSAEILKRMWPHPASVVVAFILYIGSILLFVRSVRPRHDDGHRTFLPRTKPGFWLVEPRVFVPIVVG